MTVNMATAADLSVPLAGGRHHFLLRRLHSLTGLVFGGYLVVHLLVNATIAQLGQVYQTQVNKIHDLPMLWAVEWLLIFLPILYHAIYGAYIIFTGQPNALRYVYGKNWLYLLQRISAGIIVLFALFHVLSLKYGVFGQALSFEPHNATASIHRHMLVSPWVAWGVYPLGILASCFHLANGLWAAAITWGLTVSATAQRRWGLICVGIFVLTMVLGTVALVAAVKVNPAAPAAIHS